MIQSLFLHATPVEQSQRSILDAPVAPVVAVREQSWVGRRNKNLLTGVALLVLVVLAAVTIGLLVGLVGSRSNGSNNDNSGSEVAVEIAPNVVYLADKENERCVQYQSRRRLSANLQQYFYGSVQECCDAE